MSARPAGCAPGGTRGFLPLEPCPACPDLCPSSPLCVVSLVSARPALARGTALCAPGTRGHLPGDRPCRVRVTGASSRDSVCRNQTCFFTHP